MKRFADSDIPLLIGQADVRLGVNHRADAVPRKRKSSSIACDDRFDVGFSEERLNDLARTVRRRNRIRFCRKRNQNTRFPSDGMFTGQASDVRIVIR